MELNIQSETNIKDFCEWLIPIIRDYVWDNLKPKKLEAFDYYINGSNILKFNYDIKRIVKTKDLIAGTLYNLQVKVYGNKYTIQINPNIPIPETSAKFIDIAKLVNYGNLNLQGYPIITKAMDYTAANINSLYSKFLKEKK